MRPLDVGVIGCGTAGSAAAVLLARAGHAVTVYERVAEPGPVGAGITLQPTGLHVLYRLGAYDHVVSRGARIERLLCETPARRTIVDLAYESVGAGLFGVGLHRGVLFEVLYDLVRRGPASLRTGVEIVDLARAPGGKSFMIDVHGERHGPHDLVVVADGARSQLRDDTSTRKRVRRYPWGALWFVARDLRDPSEPRTKVLHQVVGGNQTFLGFLPTGLGPAGGGGRAPPGEASGDPLVSLFWSLRGDAVDAWRRRGLAAWKDELRAMAPTSEPLLAQIEDEEQVLFAAYHDVVMDRWSTRNVVYLGDAAHATSPQLGQGCNLALWDAMVLADVLAAEPRDLVVALDRYSRERSGHLGFYQVATRWLTPFFQGDLAMLGALRDALMPIAAAVPLANRVMTLSMLGVVDGFLGRTLALELPR